MAVLFSALIGERKNERLMVNLSGLIHDWRNEGSQVVQR